MGWIRTVVNRFRPSKIVRREIDCGHASLAARYRFRPAPAGNCGLGRFCLRPHTVAQAIRSRCASETRVCNGARPDGLLMEFGVWKGMWINRIASWTDRPVYRIRQFRRFAEAVDDRRPRIFCTPRTSESARQCDAGERLVRPNVAKISGNPSRAGGISPHRLRCCTRRRKRCSIY